MTVYALLCVVVMMCSSVLQTHAAASAAAISAPHDLFESALVQLESNEIDSAYSLLQNLPESDPHFALALTELQKIHFKRAEWSKFFAYAQYYRKKTLPLTRSSGSRIQVRMLTLEALALAKHCRWDEATALLEQSKSISARVPGSLTPADLAELDHALVNLKLMQGFPEGQRTRSKSDVSPVLFTGVQYWRTQASTSLPHPRYLRADVKSRCAL